ncbi:GHKL domain-containing protein [Chitinophaga oryziterrae]|uniref:histidine kinase n=1 Tax=Chitinophaga oryziterrae TaxID=1031224 RepID=A0A6N8JGH2_9BACT|nr:7TM diverse intracellular signaling domain-containing protein [Chitinophaga oryziterrae]MVT43601.1 GHKL domain-containing protein [Chitinophaga oryziterrae]
MSIRAFFAFLITVTLFTHNTQASVPVVYSDSTQLLQMGKWLDLYTDKTNQLTFQQAINQTFINLNEQVPNLQITPYTHWARFTVTNNTSVKRLLLEIEYPTIDDISLYEPLPNGTWKVTRMGEFQPFRYRIFNHQNYIFPLPLKYGETKTYYLKIKAGEQAQLPVFLGPETLIDNKNALRNLIFGIYCGIVLVMALYNLFIYFSIRDRSYLIYVTYIICVGLTQASQHGYAFRYLYPNNSWLAMHDTVLIPILNGLTAALFIQSFLHAREKYPLGHKLLSFVIIAYLGCLVPMFANNYYVAQIWVELVALSGSFLAIYIGFKVAKTNYMPAKFFLVAWSIFLTGVIIFVMRNFNVLPYNDITYYALEVGSAAEVTLLSFALAYRINIYRQEKELSQAQSLEVSKENERLVREQNVILEIKVNERTNQLQQANDQLNVALVSLKDAQSQLVEKEKMASLGQLTAGIAHEINNPINFVTSNIKPLKLDIEDIKSLLGKYERLENEDDFKSGLQAIKLFRQEIDIDYIHEEITSLIKGIEDGATRTAEIVAGLRTFSRLDESDLKSVDIHEGLESTLVLLRTNIPKNVTVIRNYATLPKIECYAGKINQVFMNILTNAFNAIKTYSDGREEFVTITTREENGQAVISIKDTGPGMTQEVKEKIFDPFFTTKDVGEGTGLGLSIVFSIIEKHHGRINVISSPGEGAEFIIYLPMNIIPGL